MEERQPQAPVLQVNITKNLREFRLDAEFTARKGCLGILGPSGCGKSMTLKSIAGIVRPDSGRIVFQGGGQDQERVLYDREKKVDLSPQKRKVGYLFQNYALFPNMTVEENIGAGIRTGNRKEQVSQMVERFRLQGLEKRYPRQLSGGQQQRVALARMLACRPDVLLFDEPFSAMDMFLREKLRLELAEVLESCQGVSILVTHDRDEAYQLCDRLVLLDGGRMLAYGPTHDIFANPGTCQAARLTGCKNISKIRRTGTYRVRALDWGNLELTTSRPVGDEITAVGIRAHDFEPLGEEPPGGDGEEAVNVIPVGKATITEMPFEWYVTLENGLWWKVAKDIRAHAMTFVPGRLRVRPEAVLLLK